MKRLVKSKERIAVVSDLFGGELDEVGDELVDGRVCTEGGKSRQAIFFVGRVEDGNADTVEIKVELFGDDMFDQRFDVNVIGTRGCSEMLIS